MARPVSSPRRTDIVTAAIEMIAGEGVEEMTFEKIARATGLKRAHIVYYFKTRSDLLEAVLIEVLTEGGRIIDGDFARRVQAGPRNWHTDFEAYCAAQETWVRERHAHLKCLLLLYHLGAANPRFRALLRQSRDKGRARLLQLLSRHPKLGELPLSHMTAYCHAIHETVTGYLLYQTAFLDDESVEYEASTSLRQRLETLLP